MFNPFQVVRDFERVVAEYTGAPYCVAVNSCTSALLLAIAFHLRFAPNAGYQDHDGHQFLRPAIEIPKRTYLSVPMSIIHAGGHPIFRDTPWGGAYELKPLGVWDSARWFTQELYKNLYDQSNVDHPIVCTSHHWSKTLGIQQGGCILHDDPEADTWLRRARFDGRTEGVAPKDDKITQVGWHCYMTPEVAAQGLVRMSLLPRNNEPLPNDDYPDLSQMEIFR